MDIEQERSRVEAILKEHQTMLRGYLRHLVSDPHDADDLAQEVCLAVLERPEILLRGADPAAYLRGIARHFASRHHRRIKRDAVLEAVMDVAWSEEPPRLSAEERGALKDCLAKLEEHICAMLVWRYVDGLNSTEIGRRLSRSADAVPMALARGRQALTKCLKGRVSLEQGSQT